MCENARVVRLVLHCNSVNKVTTADQCNSSYGFSVTVTITINLFDIFQLQLQLTDFSVTITVTDPVIKS